MGRKVKYKRDKDITLELVACSAKDRLIQVRINGVLTGYKVRGDTELIIDQVQRCIKFALPSEALRIIRQYQDPHSKTLTDIFDDMQPLLTRCMYPNCDCAVSFPKGYTPSDATECPKMGRPKFDT